MIGDENLKQVKGGISYLLCIADNHIKNKQYKRSCVILNFYENLKWIHHNVQNDIFIFILF
ncbi:hypothetical protein TAMYLO_120057 [Tenacibaculum amylolyticum]